jgi:hypothetical protein
MKRSFSVGQLVAVRPADPDLKDKTFLGLFMGEVALGLAVHVEDNPDGTIEIQRRQYSPMFFVPELGRMIFGYESWWSQIDTIDQFRQITTKEIRDLWYVKCLRALLRQRSERNRIYKRILRRKRYRRRALGLVD